MKIAVTMSKDEVESSLKFMSNAGKLYGLNDHDLSKISSRTFSDIKPLNRTTNGVSTVIAVEDDTAVAFGLSCESEYTGDSLELLLKLAKIVLPIYQARKAIVALFTGAHSAVKDAFNAFNAKHTSPVYYAIKTVEVPEYPEVAADVAVVRYSEDDYEVVCTHLRGKRLGAEDTDVALILAKRRALSLASVNCYNKADNNDAVRAAFEDYIVNSNKINKEEK